MPGRLSTIASTAGVRKAPGDRPRLVGTACWPGQLRRDRAWIRPWRRAPVAPAPRTRYSLRLRQWGPGALLLPGTGNSLSRCLPFAD